MKRGVCTEDLKVAVLTNVGVPTQGFFDTRHLEVDLGKRIVRGGAITMIAQAGSFFLNLAQTAVLARLLTPDDFGLIGMVAVVTGFVLLFKDAGLSMATIHRKEITHKQISNLFWVNVFLSILCMVAIAASAPLITWFYGRCELLWITMALAGAFVFSGLVVQHQALLRRQMQFGRLAFLQLSGQIVTATVAVLLAWQGATYWALVFSQYAGGIYGVVAMYVVCPWRPGWVSRGAGVRGMLSYGRDVASGNVVNYLAANTDRLLVGKVLGGATLGIYEKAWQLLLMPLRQLNSPVTAVMLPALSRLQDDPVRYRSHYLKAAAGIVVLTTPVVAICVGMTDWLVLWYLGSQWSAVVPLFRVLAICAFLMPICNTTGWLFLSQGRANEQFRWQSFDAVVRVGVIVGGLPWGLFPMVILLSIVRCLLPSVLFWYVGRKGPVTIKDMFGLAGIAVFAGLIGVGGGVGTRFLLQPHLPVVLVFPLALVACIAGCGVVFLAFSTTRAVLGGASR